MIIGTKAIGRRCKQRSQTTSTTGAAAELLKGRGGPPVRVACSQPSYDLLWMESRDGLWQSSARGR
jgi:hypothetical protein